MTKELTTDEMLPIMNDGQKAIDIVNKTIKYCRYIDKQNKKSITDKIGGLEYLSEILTKGYITMDLYLQMRQAVENPDREYNITLINQ